MLILMVGLPGTGKSTLSRALVERFGGFVIDKDVIRPALFGPSQIEYSVEQDDFCQNVCSKRPNICCNERRSCECSSMDGHSPVNIKGGVFSRSQKRSELHWR